MKIILILLSVFLTLFSFSGSGLSITYGDFLSFIIFIIFVHDFLKGRLKFNLYSKIWFSFLFLMFFTSVVNITLTEGRFMNIFKTNIFSLIYFVYVYSIITTKKSQLKYIIYGLPTLAILFLVKTWPEMQKAWANSSSDFTNVEIFESSLNLNTWGYILVLFFIFSMYCWISKIYSKLSIAFSFLFLVFLFFSYSRTAYTLIGFILFWVIFYVNKTNVKRLILPAASIVLLFIFKDSLNIFNFQVTDAALEFYEKKSSTYSDDLVDTRFYLINIVPIYESFSEFNFFQMLFGDGVSIQHSFISHNLIVFGIVGLFLYLKRFIITIKYCFKTIKKNKNNVIASKFIILILVVILINDFVTNVSNFLPFASYLSSVILALFFADLEVKKKINDI